jgi:uncharacterized damage-inducible protein DinB
MITPAHAQLMARYNRWQNQSLYTAADQITDADRKSDQGAFFGSIHATLNHLLWGDQTWMHRFAGTPAPQAKSPRESVQHLLAWEDLKRERQAFDETIIAWAGKLDPAWLEDDMTWYSGAAGREISRPRWLIVTHFFNHQTHHRGQVHGMLTRLGAKPEATDLMLIQ